MATLNPYLNFNGNTEEAFNFYKSVFGGEFMGGIMRWGDNPDGGEFAEADKNKVMHVALSIGESLLMGTDSIDGVGPKLQFGNNLEIMISPQSREEADRLFKGLSNGGKTNMPMADVFWGAYFGSLTDKFDVNWMIHYDTNQQNKG